MKLVKEVRVLSGAFKYIPKELEDEYLEALVTIKDELKKSPNSKRYALEERKVKALEDLSSGKKNWDMFIFNDDGSLNKVMNPYDYRVTLDSDGILNFDEKEPKPIKMKGIFTKK